MNIKINRSQNRIVKMEYKLQILLIELENKKREIENYLLQIEDKIKIIKNEIHNEPKTTNIDKNTTKKHNKKMHGCGMTDEYAYSGDEYDSDDSMDRLYLMDLPKFFEQK